MQNEILLSRNKMESRKQLHAGDASDLHHSKMTQMLYCFQVLQKIKVCNCLQETIYSFH